jgi:hypothetical protein
VTAKPVRTEDLPEGLKEATGKSSSKKKGAPRKDSSGPQVSAPMAERTRSKTGSRAGGFGPGVGGSGQKDTCVASSHPSKT